MAMKPFCGYHFGDYFAHWLAVGARAPHAPKIFHVNWFRKDADGRFMWPGFGENMRVLAWILARCDGSAGAHETPIGILPRREDFDLDGLGLEPTVAEALFEVDRDAWRRELTAIGAYLDELEPRVPAALGVELQRVTTALAG
jgi:phosphoenolpyruvate carboxykinase (GTP)